MSAGSTKIRGALRRAKGLVITTGYRVWRRLPLRARLGLKKIAGKLPAGVQAKLQRSTGMQVPAKAKPKPTFTAAQLQAASVRPGLAEHTQGQAGVPRIYVGPVDRAGQAAALSAALRAAGTVVHSVQHSEQDTHGLAVDRKISAAVAQVSDEWQRAELDWVAANFTHVLSVGGHALFGELFTRYAALVEADLLRGYGVRTGFFLSDGVRLAEVDRRDNPHSVFAGSPALRSQRAEEQAQRLVRQLQDLDVPLFVETPDLLGALPGAHWLPAAVPPEAVTPADEGAGMEGANPAGEVPAADAHVVQLWVGDARSAQREVAAKLEHLAQNGTITYEQVNQQHLDRVRQVVRPGTVVVDDLQLGSYSVAAAHALARGAALISNITELNQGRIQAIAGQAIPTVPATPQNAVEQVRELISNAQRRAELAAAAQQYAAAVHSGELSARVLSRQLLGQQD